MPRGGRRKGAGGKSKWKHGKTKTIRVPQNLADKILDYAHKLDNEDIIEHETESKTVTGIPVTVNNISKTINLSGVPIQRYKGKSFLFLESLVNLGYEIEPRLLAERVLEEIYKYQIQQGDLSNGF